MFLLRVMDTLFEEKSCTVHWVYYVNYFSFVSVVIMGKYEMTNTKKQTAAALPPHLNPTPLSRALHRSLGKLFLLALTFLFSKMYDINGGSRYTDTEREMRCPVDVVMWCQQKIELISCQQSY